MPAFQVTNVASDQIENANQDLVNVYDITFTVGSQPGQFSVQVEQKLSDPVAAAAQAMQAVADQVNGIYAL